MVCGLIPRNGFPKNGNEVNSSTLPKSAKHINSYLSLIVIKAGRRFALEFTTLCVYRGHAHIKSLSDVVIPDRRIGRIVEQADCQYCIEDKMNRLIRRTKCEY